MQIHAPLAPQGVSQKRLESKLKVHEFPFTLLPARTSTTTQNRGSEEDLIDFSTEKEVIISIPQTNSPSAPKSQEELKATRFQAGLDTSPPHQSGIYTTLWQYRQTEGCATMFGPNDVRGLTAEPVEPGQLMNQEPVELHAEPVEWPIVIAERKRQRLVNVGGVDFVMMTPPQRATREGGKKEKEKSQLAKKVGKVFGRKKE